MDDLFLPGWQVPPGTWPYSIQDLLQAVFPPAAAPSDAGARSSSSSAGPPSGGLLGVLAKPNIDWNRGFAASDSPAGGGFFHPSTGATSAGVQTVRIGCRQPCLAASARDSRFRGVIHDRKRCHRPVRRHPARRIQARLIGCRRSLLSKQMVAAFHFPYRSTMNQPTFSPSSG
jgi:hypothetical protein